MTEHQLPNWVDNGDGYTCDDDHQHQLGFICEFYGFDLPRFDLWLAALPACPMKEEMLERRALAEDALRRNDSNEAKHQLEFLHTISWHDRREQFLLPLARRDKKRQDGTTKERRPEINEWIKKMLSRDPDAKSPALWEGAPDWITDQIGYDRFSKRVTEVRKELNGRK